MNRKRAGWWCAAVVIAGGAAFALRADDPASKPAAAAPQSEHDAWMHLKLISSQEVFNGLTHGEFHKIETAARRMLALNLLEQWVKRKQFQRQSEYQGQLNAFEFSVKELVRTAEAHDTEGALEAYVRMSRSCVRCHELIRDPQPTAP